MFSIVVPLILLCLFYLFITRLLSDWPSYATGALAIGVTAVGVVSFSTGMFRIIARQDRNLASQYAELEQRLATERRLRAQMEALHQASLAIAAARNTDETLQRLVDLARDLIGAKYAALGVVGIGSEIDAFYTSGISREDRTSIGAPPSGHGVLGVMLHQGAPVRIADLSTDPRRSGFPAGHPEMRTLLGVPVSQGGNIVGNLYLADKVGAAEFAEDDEGLLSMLASYAAVVIEHARMSERIRMLAVASERERIRMDLHDSVIQAIFGVNLELECAHDDLEAKPGDARARISGAIERLEQVIKELRSYVLGLKAEDDADSLPEALAALLARTHAHSLLETELDVRGPAMARLPQAAADELLQIAREAVTNVVRHARAGCIWITLQGAAGFVELKITDNGAGFDTNAAHAPEHQGLRNMSDRALALGGCLTIQSEPGGGATVSARVPVAVGGLEEGRG